MVSNLVGGWPTPLKNDGVRQLGWWHSQYIRKNKTCSKAPNRTWCTFGDLGSLEIFRPCWTSLTARGSGNNRCVTHGPMAANDSTVTSHTQWFFRLMIIDLVCWADAVIGWAEQPANYNIYIYIKNRKICPIEIVEKYPVSGLLVKMGNAFTISSASRSMTPNTAHSLSWVRTTIAVAVRKKRDFSNSRVWWMLHNSI